MSKTKQKVIQPLFSDYDDKIWWEYNEFSDTQLLSIDEFFKKNSKDLPTYITHDFYQTLNNLHKLIGLKPHPILAEEPSYFQDHQGQKNQGGQYSQEELPANTNKTSSNNNNNNNGAPNDEQDMKNLFLMFQNIRIDLFTLKLLQIILPSFHNFSSLKFCNNNFNQSQCNYLLQILNMPNCSIQKLFFEWNPLDQLLQQSFIPELQEQNGFLFPNISQFFLFNCLFLIICYGNINSFLQKQQTHKNAIINIYIHLTGCLTYINHIFDILQRGRTSLEFLVLRSCQITDGVIVNLLEAFKQNPNTNIKYLELYNNQIGGQGIRAIGSFIENYLKLEYIGLAKNGISNLDDMKEIFSNIGKKALSPEELGLYKEKEKEKEAIILKATKNKKKITEDMYPHLDPLVQLSDGQFAILKNTQMKMINLSMNNISDADGEYLEKYLTMTTEDLQLVLFNNNFEGKYKDKLKKKHKKNVQI